MRRFIAFVEHFFTALTRYSPSARRGVILLLGIAAAVLVVVVFRPAQAPDEAFLGRTDRLADSLRTDRLRRMYPPTASRPGSANRREAPFLPKPAVYIELNSADSARLTTVRGIGPVIARNIADYRRRLGGFAAKEQLREVRGITDENFESIGAQFFIDTAVIQKIDINFASANSLRGHPCFTESMVERIVRARTKGGWSTLKELMDRDILLPHEAEKVAPYVVFGAH
jgi:DNA uptake protein ComE-like DNA-binding protein